MFVTGGRWNVNAASYVTQQPMQYIIGCQSAAFPFSLQQTRLPTAINTENPAHIAPTATISDFVSIVKKGPMANMADEPNIPRTVDALNAAVAYSQNYRVWSISFQFSGSVYVHYYLQVQDSALPTKPAKRLLPRERSSSEHYSVLLYTHLFVIELL